MMNNKLKKLLSLFLVLLLLPCFAFAEEWEEEWEEAEEWEEVPEERDHQ